MSTLNKKLGEKIKKLRHDAHLTQEAFAQRINVHPSFIGPIEKGLKSPSLATLERIAESFDAPLYKLFLFDEKDGATEVYAREFSRLISARPKKEWDLLLKVTKDVITVCSCGK